jgi:hypothetical protein
MPLANNALTTLDAVKNYLEIELADASQDETLIQQINGVSADMLDYVRFDISADYLLPKDATEKIPQTLPCNIVSACIELVAIAYQRRGSEHLKTEVVGPLRSDFTNDWPLHIQQTLDRYREYMLV